MGPLPAVTLIARHEYQTCGRADEEQQFGTGLFRLLDLVVIANILGKHNILQNLIPNIMTLLLWTELQISYCKFRIFCSQMGDL